MQIFSKLVNTSSKVLELVLTALMALLVINVSWQVITRFIMPEPSSFTEELSRFMLIWIGLLGASLAYKEGMHLGIDILTNKLSGVKKRVADISVHVISASFALAVMIIGGFKLVQLTLELNQVSPSLGVMMGHVYLAIPLSGLLIFLYSLYFIAIDLGLIEPVNKTAS